MAAPAGSQGDFFADVRRFFSLLDLDGDGLVSYGEATLGLHHCFDAVHRVRSPSSSQHSPSPPASLPSVSASHKARVVSEQVQWLFSASAPAVPAASPAASPSSSPSPSSPAPLSFPSFESCYRRLLSSGYEQEVLWLDLVRAITALSSSAHWQSMSAVCSRARRVWAERMQQGSRQEAERRRVSARIAQSLRQQAHSAQLTSALQADDRQRGSSGQRRGGCGPGTTCSGQQETRSTTRSSSQRSTRSSMRRSRAAAVTAAARASTTCFTLALAS